MRASGKQSEAVGIVIYTSLLVLGLGLRLAHDLEEVRSEPQQDTVITENVKVQTVFSPAHHMHNFLTPLIKLALLKSTYGVALFSLHWVTSSLAVYVSVF